MKSLGFYQVCNFYGCDNYCIDTYSFDGRYVYFHDVLTDKNYKTDRPFNVQWGYEYNSTSKECQLKTELVQTGLSFYDYNSLLGFSGVLFGFIILFSLVLLAFNIVRRD